PVVINATYTAQGTDEARTALAPNATWDDGRSTYFRFVGNRRLPVPYVLNPDGEEAVVDYTVQDRTLIIHKTAARFRLSDGDLILCISNGNYTPGGVNTGTGTTSPDVVREMKASK
ncbi:MAG TPA: TrbG/VirB9 family P-type conjugative transfer protein, partial [Caldimonas sp.]|nr:TrbG/VirB9 family P-type conjugative transfer protein [Caldimonas sp.]